MQLRSDSFGADNPIPVRCAFGIPGATGPMELGPNRNPHLAWSGQPPATRSLVLVCMDGDAPSSADDVNQENRVIPRDMDRADFCHWVMVDIPPDVQFIAEGAVSDGVTPRGKQRPDGPDGARQGINDYTGFLAGNEEMAGQYFGYDGPCPPWNDERVHHYCFTLYAVDLPHCPVDGPFTAAAVLAAIEGHVLARASLTGSYTLNPRVADHEHS